MEDVEPVEIEAATDEAIALCGGDARAAVKALLIANTFLEGELAMAVPAVSYGFSRGMHGSGQNEQAETPALRSQILPGELY